MVALVTAGEGRKLSEKTPRPGTERESPPDFTRDLGERGNLVEQAQAERSSPLTRTQSSAQGQKQTAGPSNPPPHQKDDGAKAAPSAHKAQPEDPQLIAIRKEQERLKDEIEKARRLAQGTSKNIESQKKELEKMGGLDWAFGTSGALKDQISADEKLLKEQQAQITKLEESARNQERLAQEVQKHTEDAKRLAAEGRQSEAQASTQLANSAAENARAASGEKMLIVTDEWRASQQQALAKYDDAISRINTTKTVVQYVDTGVKTVGVVAGTVIAGPAGGAAVSMAYDSAKNLGEQGYSVASGDKTLGEAAKDFAVKEVDAAVDAGITLATGSVGRFAGGAVGGSLKGASRIAVKMGTAAASGAAVNTAAEGTKIGYEYGKACLEFNRQNPNLQGEARTKAWAAYCEERGLTEKDVARRLGGSALSGGITGLAGGLSPGAGRLLRGGVQTGTDVLGAAAQEAVSSGNVTPGGLVTAGVLGVLAHKAGNVRRPETAGPSSVRPGVSPHHDPSDGLGPPKKAEDTSSGANANASQTHRELHAGAHSSDQPAAVQKEPQGSEHTAAQTSGHNAAESTSAPETKHLTADDILKKYEEMFPGQDGLRDLGLLEGAVARTKTAEYYEQADVNRQAAYLFKGLADNHAFHDGNKRITVQSVREFLQSNGKDLGQTTDMQLFELCDRMVAEKWSVDRTEAELSKFISSGISK